MATIDHIARIDVDESLGHNEITTLACLATGLAVLAQNVRNLEEPLIRNEQEQGKKVFSYGFGLLEPTQEQILSCMFHWFGTSLCNYARLVGYLSGLSSGVYTREQVSDPDFHDVVRRHSTAYVDSILELQSIKVWRNKVFAHFAITDPRKDDNAAILDTSVMSPISYFDSRLRVGGMTISINGEKAVLPHWSATETFEALVPRFWPTT
jgi:hypothetical protein